MSSARGLTFSPWMFRWFARYLRVYFGRNFSAVRVSRPGPSMPSRGPLVIYGDHPSWWDPIHFMLLASTYLPDREGFGPMDAAALEQYGLFRRLGAFGVEPGTFRGARAFLRASREAIGREAVLFVMAEGRFADVRERPVKLQSGLAHLAATSEPAVAVPLAFEYPFWNERRPEALSRFGDPFPIGAAEGRSVEEWGSLLEERLSRTMDHLAVESRARDPRCFRTLLDGTVGVGGFYDRWRWLSATLRGRAFRAAHEERSP